jgi:outer membrane protein assembly factor BamA
MLRNNFDKLIKMYGSRGFFNFVAVPIQDLDEKKKAVNLTINIQEDEKTTERTGKRGQ